MARSPLFSESEADLQRQGRGLGAHYTPQEVVGRIVRATLGPLCEGLPPQQVLNLRVVDPAVGSGRFLAAALEFLARAAGDACCSRKTIAAQCLFGVDVDSRAVALARQVVAEAAGCAPEELGRTIVVGDSLLADTAELLGVEAFDAVLTNPPWISYSGRQAGEIGAERRRLLAERYASFHRWPTTHGAFLELAARLLRPGGRAALVLPHQVCHLAGYEAARRAALASCSFEPPPEPIGEGSFPGVVQPAAIVCLHRASGEAASMPDADQNPVGRAILEKMLRHPPPPRGTFRDPGVHTGNSAALLLHDTPGEGRVPVREGRCVHPFRLEGASRWLEASPSLPPGHYCRIGRPELYLGARILLRQTANRPIAARHTKPTHFRNSILACYGVRGLDDATLLGLLNSSLLGFYHRACHPDSGQRAFPQVKVSHLQALPLVREAGGLAPMVTHIEALAARPPRWHRHLACGRAQAGSLCHQAELAEALAALDEAVFGLYALTDTERTFVREQMGEEKGRGRLAAL